MLSGTNKHNRALSGSNCTEGTTTFSMTVKFGNDNWTNFNCFVEGHGLIETSLTNTSVHYETSSVWFYSTLNLLHFFKKSSFLLVSSRGIYNYYFKLLISEELNTLLCNFDRISLFLMTKERTLDFCSIHLELLKSTSSECIGADQTNTPSFLHVVICEFRAGCSFTRSLKPHEHDYIWLAFFELIGAIFCRLEHICKLFNNGPLN